MDYREIAEKTLKGTTTVGIVCSDGIVLGSDSRATYDTFIATTDAVKIYKINDTLGITIAGGLGDAEYLMKVMKVQNELYKMNEGKNLSPTSATSLLSLILQENKYAPYLVQLIVGGLNSSVPEIYSLDPAGGYVREAEFVATGSGSPVATGYLEEIYSKDKTVQEVVKHVVKALRTAMKRDSATGNNVRLVTITKSGGYKEYYGPEVDKFVK